LGGERGDFIGSLSISEKRERALTKTTTRIKEALGDLKGGSNNLDEHIVSGTKGGGVCLWFFMKKGGAD